MVENSTLAAGLAIACIALMVVIIAWALIVSHLGLPFLPKCHKCGMWSWRPSMWRVKYNMGGFSCTHSHKCVKAKHHKDKESRPW